jgi:hypothetical protein
MGNGDRRRWLPPPPPPPSPPPQYLSDSRVPDIFWVGSAVPTRAHSPDRSVGSAVPTRAHSSDRSVGSAVPTRASEKWFGVPVFCYLLLFILGFSSGILSSAVDVRYEIIWAVITVILWFGIYGLPDYAVLYGRTLASLIAPVFGLVIRSGLLDWPWGKNLYVSFVTSLILAPVLLYGLLSLRYFMPEVVFRYKMWERLDSFLGAKRAIALSDYVRGMMPSLAACNPFLKDAVVSSTQKSQFIARWSDWAQFRHQIHVEAIEFQDTEGNTLEQCAYSYFEIGSGKISVDASPQCENNFKFESTARGRVLEKFVTITDWNRIAKIFRILRYWEKSPDLGVIENLYVVDGDGIYCHCLSVQSIVEGVCKSPEQFSLFELSEPRRFYVGSSPQKKRNEDKNRISFGPRLSTSLSVAQAGFSIILAVSEYSRVQVIVGLFIGLALAFVVFIDGLTSHFPLKLFVHYVLATILSDDCRYGFYRWLKRKGCFLAFCDDFNPVLHRASDETELITLHNCTPGNSFTTMVHQLNWDKINIGFCQSYTWHGYATGFKFPTVVPTTSVSTTVSRSIHDFESHRGRWRYFQLTWRESTNHSRTLTAWSELCNPNDIEATVRENVLWHTQLRLDHDDLQHLYWREPSYLLFIYLMLLWKGRRFGVISDFRRFWYANYYHVFSTYELARHIEENEKNDSNMLNSSYHILIEKPKHTDMVAGYVHCKDVSFVFYFASPALDFIIRAKSKKTLYLLPTPEFLCC